MCVSHQPQPLLLLVQPLAHELLEQRLVRDLLQRGDPLEPLLHVLVEAQGGDVRGFGLARLPGALAGGDAVQYLPDLGVVFTRLEQGRAGGVRVPELGGLFGGHTLRDFFLTVDDD